MLPLENYYFLLHAFDVLGRRLYPTDWTGDEFDQRDMEAPGEVAAKLKPVDEKLAEIDAELEANAAAIRRETGEAEMASLQQKRVELFANRTAALDERRPLQKLDDTYSRDYAAYQRRIKTEEALFGALESGKIRAQYGRSLLLDWASWSHEPGFKCYLELSLLKAPHRRSGLSRAAVLIRREEFDQWLQTRWPTDPVARAAMLMEQRCEEWLANFVRDNDGKKPSSKSMIYVSAKKALTGLPRRLFDRVWSGQVVPADWRRKGAPPQR